MKDYFSINKKEDPVIIILYYNTSNKKGKITMGYIFVQPYKYKVTV